MGDTPRIDVLDRAGLSVAGTDEHPDYVARLIGQRLLAVARTVGVAFTVLAGMFGDDLWAGYWALAGFVMLAQLASLRLAFSASWERASRHVVPVLGLCALGGVVAASGGAQSHAASVLVAFPAIGAFAFRRARIVVTATILLLALTAASLPDVLEGEPLAGRFLLANTLAVTFSCLIGLSIATGRELLRDRLAQLHLLRRLLLTDALSATATERRRISGELGSGPLQLLLAAAQDLEELEQRPGTARDVDRCVATLRQAADRLRATVVQLRADAPAEQRRKDADPPVLDDARVAARMLAVLRVAAAPPIAAAAFLGAPGEAWEPSVIALVLLMAGVQALALRWSFSERWESFPAVRLAYGDMIGVGALIALSGGVHSPVIALAPLLPMTFVLLGPPGVQLRVVAVLGTAILGATLPDVLDHRTGSGALLLTALLTLTWTTGVTLLVTLARSRLERRTADLEAARRRLLRESVAAQDDERTAVARSLHDESLQLVLAAIQELLASPEGTPEEAVGRALAHTRVAAHSLRDGAEALHPSALEHGGLAPALRGLALRAAEQGGCQVTVSVVDDADHRHDELLVRLTRELVTNVAKHAGATQVRVVLEAEAHAVVLTVADDGVGMEEERPERALEEGHVGLASCREQVEAEGGTLTVRSTRGHGTTVVVRLP